MCEELRNSCNEDVVVSGESVNGNENWRLLRTRYMQGRRVMMGPPVSRFRPCHFNYPPASLRAELRQVAVT